MEYRKIPDVGKPVSRIFFGTAIPLFLAGQDGNSLLDAVFDLGINAFDTARNYQLAEKTLGDWMAARENREKVVVLSKCGHPDETSSKRVNERDMRADFARSRALLRTDYIDIYLLHRDDPDTEVAVPLETFNALHAEGKIGAFGGSNWTHRRIEAANEYAYKHGLIPFSVSSPNFGLADQVQDPFGGGCVTISGPANQEARAWYARTGMPVIAYSSLGRGLFSGRLRSTDAARADQLLDAAAVKGYAYPANFRRLARCEEIAARRGCTVAQIAMAWIYCQPLNTFAVVSLNRPAHMEQNIQALSLALTKEEISYLDLQDE